MADKSELSSLDLMREFMFADFLIQNLVGYFVKAFDAEHDSVAIGGVAVG